MEEKKFRELLKSTAKQRSADYEATINFQARIISKMVEASHREAERLEHHLLEMPLSVIIYQWIILRLKSRPWRLLIPASVALSLLLQGLLSRINLLQLLAH